jgi:hypothetical protein
VRQLVIAVETLALMGAITAAGAPGWLIYVLAVIGGTAASRYDHGAHR